MKEKYTIYLVTGLIAYLSPILTSLLCVGGLVMFDWFTVNPEVLSLFTEEQLAMCVPYEDIILPTHES